MSRVSFTLKKDAGGSTLQDDPTLLTDDDSALRGDAFGGDRPKPPDDPLSPSVPTFGGSSTFGVTPIDYGVALVEWNIGTALATELLTSAQPTEIVIRYSTIGEPMSPAEGSLVATIQAGQEVYSMEQDDLPEGSWVYYSLFAKFESTTLRPWYERLASLVVLMPQNYGSTDLLWSRIPEHYRINDSVDEEVNDLVPDDLWDKGPLYRVLSSFGWEMDQTRTLSHYLMLQKDPDLATPEVLDALAYDLGVDVRSNDLGSARLRGILSDIRYLREFKGTVQGVREWLTAISGCDVNIRPVQSNVLTTAQSKFSGNVTTTTSELNLPSGDDWVLTGTGIGASINPTKGLVISKTSASGYIVARTRIPAVEQAEWYQTYIDVLGRNDAQVLGVSMSSSVQTMSSLTLTGGVVEKPYPQGFRATTPFGTDDWYQVPVDIGIPGNGTLTTTPMYLTLFLRFDRVGASLALNNVVVKKNSMYPYAIDIYSQRANIVRDPQFNRGVRKATGASGPVISTSYSWSGGTGSYWSAYSSGNSLTTYVANKGLGASVGTAASVMIASTGSSTSNTPILLGTPYYLSVDDPLNKIAKVSLISRTYGVLASSTTPALEQDIGGEGRRKNFVLFRDYTAPWLPESITDCYVVFHANLLAGQQLLISKPLLEAFNFSGDYFDGDTVDGGWLQTSTVAGSIRDYRWGDAGGDISFSYYTSDFQRTRNTIDRLLPSLVPVTQSVTLTDSNYNRIYGYTGAGLP